jgi:hypothetical protein
MALSVMKDFQGPDWPLGLIVVVTPGTPVSIMSLVDAGNVNAPETAFGNQTSPQTIPTGGQQEYSVLAQQIMFQGVKSTAGNAPLVNNSGNIYICRKGTTGLGNRTDFGAIVAIVPPGQTLFLASSARNRDTWSPYRYYIDADNANDSALVTLLVQ